jgi:hypothetical protein
LRYIMAILTIMQKYEPSKLFHCVKNFLEKLELSTDICPM